MNHRPMELQRNAACVILVLIFCGLAAFGDASQPHSLGLDPPFVSHPRAFAKFSEGKYRSSITLLQQVVSKTAKTIGGSTVEYADALLQQVHPLRAAGRFEKAINSTLDALRIFSSILSVSVENADSSQAPQDSERLEVEHRLYTTLRLLGVLHMDSGDYQSAREFFLRVFDPNNPPSSMRNVPLERVLGLSPKSLVRIGEFLFRAGDYDLALLYFKIMFDKTAPRVIPTEGNSYTVVLDGSLHENPDENFLEHQGAALIFAEALRELGYYAMAERLYGHAVSFAANRPSETTTALLTLGVRHLACDQQSVLVGLGAIGFRWAFLTSLRHTGGFVEDKGTSYYITGAYALEAGRYSEAVRVFSALEAHAAAQFGRAHPDYLDSLLMLAVAMIHETGYERTALEHLATVRQGLKTLLGDSEAEQTITYIRAVVQAAIALHNMGDSRRSVRYLRKASKLSRQFLDPQHPLHASILSLLVRTHEDELLRDALNSTKAVVSFDQHTFPDFMRPAETLAVTASAVLHSYHKAMQRWKSTEYYERNADFHAFAEQYSLTAFRATATPWMEAGDLLAVEAHLNSSGIFSVWSLGLASTADVVALKDPGSVQIRKRALGRGLLESSQRMLIKSKHARVQMRPNMADTRSLVMNHAQQVQLINADPALTASGSHITPSQAGYSAGLIQALTVKTQPQEADFPGHMVTPDGELQALSPTGSTLPSRLPLTPSIVGYIGLFSGSGSSIVLPKGSAGRPETLRTLIQADDVIDAMESASSRLRSYPRPKIGNHGNTTQAPSLFTSLVQRIAGQRAARGDHVGACTFVRLALLHLLDHVTAGVSSIPSGLSDLSAEQFSTATSDAFPINGFQVNRDAAFDLPLGAWNASQAVRRTTQQFHRIMLRELRHLSGAGRAGEPASATTSGHATAMDAAAASIDELLNLGPVHVSATAQEQGPEVQCVLKQRARHITSDSAPYVLQAVADAASAARSSKSRSLPPRRPTRQTSNGGRIPGRYLPEPTSFGADAPDEIDLFASYGFAAKRQGFCRSSRLQDLRALQRLMRWHLGEWRAALFDYYESAMPAAQVKPASSQSAHDPAARSHSVMDSSAPRSRRRRRGKKPAVPDQAPQQIAGEAGGAPSVPAGGASDAGNRITVTPPPMVDDLRRMRQEAVAKAADSARQRKLGHGGYRDDTQFVPLRVPKMGPHDGALTRSVKAWLVPTSLDNRVTFLVKSAVAMAMGVEWEYDFPASLSHAV